MWKMDEDRKLCTCQFVSDEGDREILVMDKLDLIIDIFRDVVELVTNISVNISLAPKSANQIKAKINQYIKEEQVVKECGMINILPTE